MGHCDKNNGQHIHHTVPHDQPKKCKTKNLKSVKPKKCKTVPHDQPKNCKNDDFTLRRNLLIRLVSFLLMIKIAHMLAAMLATMTGRLAMVNARGMLFTMVAFSLTRLRLKFPPTNIISPPSSILVSSLLSTAHRD